MKLTARNTHRDIAYFYVGLIIAFSFSGIFLNHRQTLNPRRYTYETKNVWIAPFQKEQINEAFVLDLAKRLEIDDELRRFQSTDELLTISFANNDVKITPETGSGSIVTYRTIPLLGHMSKLHIDTSKWWIYYSDVFGLGMMIIAITGMFIEKGKNSFRTRGFKLALLGIIFPLIFLFLLS